MPNDIINLRNCEKCGELFYPEILDGSERYCPDCDPRLCAQDHVIDREE